MTAQSPKTPKSQAPAISIVLVRPREQGNIGSVARAMANMGLEDLVLVEPAADIGGVARGFGVGGWSVLEAARRSADLDQALATFELAVGTSSGRDRPLRGREVLDPRRLARSLPPGRRTAIVFGPEDSGLRRDELEACDLLVTIPCAAARPTLNLAQAVLLIAYELHLRTAEVPPAEVRPAEVPPARSQPLELPDTWVGERRELIESTRPLITRLGFDQEHLREGILRDLRTLLRRARPDRRQLGVLRRLVSRALQMTPSSGAFPAAANDDRE